MDARAVLVRGLQSDPKYIPFWYTYDRNGSEEWYKASQSKHYYFPKSEISVLSENKETISQEIPEECVLMDMGSGDSKKAQMFIDLILKKQTKVRYVPVDISAEFMHKASEAIANEYGDKIEVTPIPADYDVGIDKLRNIHGNKIILWIGGSLQNLAYCEQVDKISKLSQVMTERDFLLMTLDVTQNAQQVENAYIDPTGLSAPFYMNNLIRLNREYGSNIDVSTFELEAKFLMTLDVDKVSNVTVRVVSKQKQTYNIPGLGITLELDKGGLILLHEGEGTSCKYREDQVRRLVEKGGLYVDKLWIDQSNHVGMFLIRSHNGGK